MSRDFHRYAVYFAPPPDSPLGRFGNGWLGRDPAGGPAPARPEVSGLREDEIAAAVADPARYGFHATLKPPFRLAEGADLAVLFEATAGLAGTLAPVSVPDLAVRALGPFAALTPTAPVPALDALAATFVRELDMYRAPPPPEEAARRRQAGLTPRQETYLREWGYPYVLEDFRFHLTLTGRLAPDALRRCSAALSNAVGDAAAPFVIGDVAVFGEAEAGAPLRLLRRFPLGR